MNGEIEDGPETSSRGAGWGWVFWPGLVLVLYVLSFGPVLMLVDKQILRPDGPECRVIEIVYRPVMWAANETPLHKPLIMYLGLWAPSLFHNPGDWK